MIRKEHVDIEVFNYMKYYNRMDKLYVGHSICEMFFFSI